MESRDGLRRRKNDRKEDVRRGTGQRGGRNEAGKNKTDFASEVGIEISGSGKIR